MLNLEIVPRPFIPHCRSNCHRKTQVLDDSSPEMLSRGVMGKFTHALGPESSRLSSTNVSKPALLARRLGSYSDYAERLNSQCSIEYSFAKFMMGLAGHSVRCPPARSSPGNLGISAAHAELRGRQMAALRMPLTSFGAYPIYFREEGTSRKYGQSCERHE